MEILSLFLTILTNVTLLSSLVCKNFYKTLVIYYTNKYA